MAEVHTEIKRPKIKLIVEHANGRHEIITIRGDSDGMIKIVEGEFLNEIRDGAGMDHFFTKNGHYDGWGGAFSGDEESSHAAINAMEAKREFKD